MKNYRALIMRIHIYILLTPLILFSFLASAQRKPKPDTLQLPLICPFEHGYKPAPKDAYNWDPSDKKVVMIGKTDTVVRSCNNATVVKVEPAEEGSYEIVINAGDYYFWYHGNIKPSVKIGEKVKAGQALGIYSPGTELEFRMYKDEEMMDAGKLLNCETVEN